MNSLFKLKINTVTFDTFLILLCMIAPIVPNIFAKQLVVFFFLILSLRIIISKDIFSLTVEKIIIISLFAPGIYFSLKFSLNDTIRFLPILLLAVGFPFKSFKIRPASISHVSAFVILYIFITQCFIAKGNLFFLDFKEFLYPETYAPKFFEGFSKSIFINIFELNEGHTPRHGGLYSNPNDMAGIILLYYLIFDISSKFVTDANFNHHLKKKLSIINIIIFLIVIVSLLLTKSRTVLIAFTVYLFIQNVSIKDIINFRAKFKTLSYLFVTLLMVILNYEKVIFGIINPRQSFQAKLRIFTNYWNETPISKLMVGGTFDVFFDTEYGYWLGSAGLLGLTSFIFLFYMMSSVKYIKNYIIVFLTISFGMTIFYSLMNVSLVIPLIILACSINYNSYYKK